MFIFSAAILLAAASTSHAPQAGTPSVFFSCVGQDGVRTYTTRKPSSAECRATYYYDANPSRMVGAASILPDCLDQSPIGDQRLVGPSARSRECTRIKCAQASGKEAMRKYAMREKQSAESDYVGLTCITRNEQDMSGS